MEGIIESPGPPIKVGGIVHSVTSLIAYVVLLIVHIGLQIALLVLAAMIIVHPLLLRSPDVVLIIGGLAIIDILVARRL